MTLKRKPPGRIFINYRRDDTGAVAGRLADSLNSYFGGGRVFRDIDGIETGADFEDVLQRTARDAGAMIVLIGPHWLKAADAKGTARLHDPEDWVAREIAAALASKIPLYPVLVESAVMPRPEELPEVLRPLVRHNAMSIGDQRWQIDVSRLAKVVAIDMPGSATERTLRWVQWIVSVALLVSIAATTGNVAYNVYNHAARVLSLAWSGVTFVVITGCAMLLLNFAQLIDPSRRVYTYAAALVGLSGTLAFFLLLGALGVNDNGAPIIIFFGSTITAAAVLVLIGLSGFKAK
jgi:TIR domain